MFIIILMVKTVQKILKIFGKGATTLPGRIALFFKKDILKHLSKNVRVIMITGTNGKTTTARIVEEGLKISGKSYFLNRSGANLITGITTSFISNSNIFGRCKKDYAVIECDENALKKVSVFIDADFLVVTNVFRDQLDRYGEVSSTLNAIKTGAENMKNCTLVLNTDDSLSFSLSRLGNNYISYGVDCPAQYGGRGDNEYCVFCKTKLKYDYKIYSHLGSYACSFCGYKRENPQYSVTEILQLDSDSSVVFANLNGKNAVLRINLGGIYNVYNALAAGAVLAEIGIAARQIEQALSGFEGAFGRMEDFGKTKMLLVKNPAGFTQTMNYVLNLNAENLVFVLNDNKADGSDVSWIWDAEINVGASVKNIYAFGIRSGDMALRLKYEGFDVHVIDNYKQFYEICERDKTVIIPTYTAMMALRPYLAQKHKKEVFWK